MQRRDCRKYDLAKLLFEGIAEKWRERLLAYLNEVQKAGALERLLANMPQMADDEYRMQWSSTFLGGIYNELWQTLSVINIGDGGMVVVADRAQTVGPKDVRGILIATFRRRGGLDVEVSSIPVEAGWEHFKGVRGFIAASDGVAKDVRVFLSQAAEALTTQSPIDRIWAQMSLQARLTYDDRAVIVGRLVRGEGRALKSASKKVV